MWVMILVDMADDNGGSLGVVVNTGRSLIMNGYR